MALKGSYLPYRRLLVARSRALRRALTAAEKKLWFDFLRHHPSKFTRQKPLGDYIADFYCASRRIVVEVDGDSHFSSEGARRDVTRDARLRQQGIRVVRFTNEEVLERFEGVCLKIDEVLSTEKT